MAPPNNVREERFKPAVESEAKTAINSNPNCTAFPTVPARMGLLEVVWRFGYG